MTKTGYREQHQVLIRDLRIDTLIGVFDWEHKVTQELRFDLDIDLDLAAAARSDNLEDALNYAALCEMLTAVATSRHFELIETLAGKMLDEIFAGFALAQRVKLVVKKQGAVPAAEWVGVMFDRQREPV